MQHAIIERKNEAEIMNSNFAVKINVHDVKTSDLLFCYNQFLVDHPRG